MTVVVGTAGHIDHGKTSLLRALTGIDADRLPEERRRGMTLDVGYAHMALPDGSEVDFVDVPGHDRLVGNMLVGAGEIDAVILVVAADDGPRAQTIEHLELLDALGIRHGIAVITKTDIVDEARVGAARAAVERLLRGSTLAGSPVIEVSSVDGRGIAALGEALLDLRDRVAAVPGGRAAGRPSLAIDRAFTVKGRGLVVTGTLRGGPLGRNGTLRLVPGDRVVRARELQVHGRTVELAGPGRVAINLAGIDAGEVARGAVLTADPAVAATDRILVQLAVPLSDRTRVRLHLGTAAVDGAIGRAGRDAIDLPGARVAGVVRLAAPIAAAPGDRFLLRRPAGADRVVGGVVLDVAPPRGISRRRQTPERVGFLASAIASGGQSATSSARLDLHGALAEGGRRVTLAGDVALAASTDVVGAVAGFAAGSEGWPGLAAIRTAAARSLRRRVTLRRDEANHAAAELVERLVGADRLVRDGDRLRLPGATPDALDPALVAAMSRLEAALAVAAPPALADAARAAGCPGSGIRELERSGRIVVLEPGLAYAAATYRDLERRALDLARRAPLMPSALRDETGTSRKYVMAILADLDRRGILRRTDAGHVPGPRAGPIASPR